MAPKSFATETATVDRDILRQQLASDPSWPNRQKAFGLSKNPPHLRLIKRPIGPQGILNPAIEE
jgi:hypothetical protein